MILSTEEKNLVVTLLRRFIKEKHKKIRSLKPLHPEQPKDQLETIKLRHADSINFAHNIIRTLEER